MHGSLNKPGETGDRICRRWAIGVFAVPVIVVIGLIGLSLVHPAASSWISAAVQAEFTGSSLPQEAASTLMAQPAMTVRAVRLY